MSISTFEHLIMPWKVVIEISRILKLGGIGFVHTHQSIGMHDIPHDFWRYSDTAWQALFNKATGFEILRARLEEMMYLLPDMLNLEKDWCYEHSRGFEGSNVLVRKINEPSVDWNVKSNEIIDTQYPKE